MPPNPPGQRPGPASDKCGGCKFYWDHNDLPDKNGYCLLRDPQVAYMGQGPGTMTMGRWPVVYETWWCGQYVVAP